MRIRLLTLSVLLMLWASALAHANEHPPYYLALGDSLAQGLQPLGTDGADVETNHGYVDDLYALLSTRTPERRAGRVLQPLLGELLRLSQSHFRSERQRSAGRRRSD